MTISMPSTEIIQIKTKNVVINFGKENIVNDFVLTGPGEYEIGGVEIIGIGQLYIIETEDMRIGYLDKLNRPLTDEEQEDAADVDILFVPVGGEDVLSPKDAMKVITQIDPRIVIPVYYSDIEAFSKEEGITPEFMDNLKITRANLPETERKVIVLPWKSSKA